MGVEVTDICMDKESDCVIVYSNGVSQDLNNEPFPMVSSHHDAMHSYANLDRELEARKKAPRQKNMKECTSGNSVEKSEPSHVENGKKKLSMLSSNSESGLPADKVKQETSKTKNNKSSVEASIETCSANVRMKHNVPQPFALATEKCASCGTRPSPAEPNAGTGVNNSSITNTMKPNLKALLCFHGPLSRREPLHQLRRLDIRKQFYSKHHAREAEKTEREVRTKEEREAAIKQFRKSLTFKQAQFQASTMKDHHKKLELKKVIMRTFK